MPLARHSDPSTQTGVQVNCAPPPSLVLKGKIAGRYRAPAREQFDLKDIWRISEMFLEEYPVVLSTTYSAKSCISKEMVFDYVIMDEASQVDIDRRTGFVLRHECRSRDDKQLPNIVDPRNKRRATGHHILVQG